MQIKGWQYGMRSSLPRSQTEQLFLSEIKEFHSLQMQLNRKECKGILITPNKTVRGYYMMRFVQPVNCLTMQSVQSINTGMYSAKQILPIYMNASCKYQTKTSKAEDVSLLWYMSGWHKAHGLQVREIVMGWHEEVPKPVMEIVRGLHSTDVCLLLEHVGEFTSTVSYLVHENVKGCHIADLRLLFVKVNGWHTAELGLVYENVNGCHIADLRLLFEKVSGWHTAELGLVYKNVNGWHTADLRVLFEILVNGWHTADLVLVHEKVNGCHIADLRLLFEKVSGWHTAELGLVYKNVNGWHIADMRLLFEKVNGWHTAELGLVYENVNGWHIADLRLLFEILVNGWHTADLVLVHEKVNGWHTVELVLVHEKVNGWHTADFVLVHEKVNGWHTAELELVHENVNGCHIADLRLLFDKVNIWHTADLGLVYENVNGFHTPNLWLLFEKVNGCQTAGLLLVHENVNGCHTADLWLVHVNANGWHIADLWLLFEKVNGWHTAGLRLVCVLHENVNGLHTLDLWLLFEKVNEWHTADLRLVQLKVNQWQSADLCVVHKNVNGRPTSDLWVVHENVKGRHTADFWLLFEKEKGWHRAVLWLKHKNVNRWHTVNLRLVQENVNGWRTTDLRQVHENVNGWHAADMWLLFEKVNGLNKAVLWQVNENVNRFHPVYPWVVQENENERRKQDLRLVQENVNGWQSSDLRLVYENLNGLHTVNFWLVHDNENGWYLVVMWLVHENVNRLLENVRGWHTRKKITTLPDLKSSLAPVSSRTEIYELFEWKSFSSHADRPFMDHHRRIVTSSALQSFLTSSIWEIMSAFHIADDDHTIKCIFPSIAILCEDTEKHDRILFERNEYMTKYRLVLYDEVFCSEREKFLELLYASFYLYDDLSLAYGFLGRHQNACVEWSVIDSLPYLSFLRDMTDRKVNILAENHMSPRIFLEQIFRSIRLSNNHFNFCETELGDNADFNITRKVDNKGETPIDGGYPVMETTEHQEHFNVSTGHVDTSVFMPKVENDEFFRDVRTKIKLRLAVLPEMPTTDFIPADSTASVNWPTSTDPFQAGYAEAIDVNKHKMKTGEQNNLKKNVDKIALARDYIWLPFEKLPNPTVDLTVAYVPTFTGTSRFPPLMVIIDQIAAGKPPAPHVSMRYELLRFCTLRSYPTEDKPYLTLLAAAGFYYASDGDGVVCYCCGIRRYNWTADDNPMKIHRKINPTCKFLTKNEEVNVRNEFNGPFSKSLMFIDSIPEPGESQEPVEDINNDWAPERTRSPAPRPQNESTPSKAGINTAMPKHSQYATKTSRIASFNGWPDTASHSPDTLADAGFFYAGYGDCVRCFYCGIGLRHWTQDDNPWIEHARWSKNCVFVKQKKGEEFLSLVQLAVQYAENSESQESIAENQQLPPQEIENILLSDAAQSVLEMGYQPRIIKKAIEQILRQDRQAKITAQSLMEKVLEIEEADKPTQVPQVPPAAAAAATATVGPTEGATCSAPDESAKFDQKVNENKLAEKKNTSENIKGEHKIKPAKSGEGGKVYGANDASHIDPKAIKAENEQLKEQTLCKVCLDQTVSIVFLPCGHLVTCADCAPAMRTCPICRATVKGTVKTYMA